MNTIKMPSPCISICELNEDTGFCDGCFRTRKEIAQWPSLDENEKLNLLDVLRNRQGIRRRINRRQKSRD